MGKSAASAGDSAANVPRETAVRRIRFIVSPCRICFRWSVWQLWPSHGLLTSEVNDDVCRADEGVVAVSRDAEVGVAVERERIQRLVVGKLRPDLDLRREPMLPADAGLEIRRLGAGALTLHVVVPLNSVGDVVE